MLTNKVGRPMITDMETTAVGRELRRARLGASYTLARLAETTDLPVRTIHGIETGENRKPDENILRRLGDTLEPHTSYRVLAMLVYNLQPA